MHNILVADDEDMLRRNLALILNSAGYSTFSARSSNEAIAMFNKRHFDILITDMVMPEKGGGELIMHVNEHWPDTHIIIMTAYPSTNSAIKAIKHGVVEYFTKPFKTEDMLEAIRNVLESKKEVPFSWHKLSSYKVTAKEMGVLRAMVEECITENKDLADKFLIKPSTVKQHLENLYGKFDVHNRTALVSAVIKALRK